MYVYNYEGPSQVNDKYMSLYDICVSFEITDTIMSTNRRVTFCGGNIQPNKAHLVALYFLNSSIRKLPLPLGVRTPSHAPCEHQ